jgi:hypothetical protein
MDVNILDAIIRFGLTAATGFLFGIVFLSYWRTRTSKMLLISIGFAIFFVHALLTLPELFSSAYQIAMDEDVHLTIHLVALVFILLGILKD